jgi:hypothetical protein
MKRLAARNLASGSAILHIREEIVTIPGLRRLNYDIWVTKPFIIELPTLLLLN